MSDEAVHCHHCGAAHADILGALAAVEAAGYAQQAAEWRRDSICCEIESLEPAGRRIYNAEALQKVWSDVCRVVPAGYPPGSSFAFSLWTVDVSRDGTFLLVTYSVRPPNNTWSTHEYRRAL